MAVTSWKGGGGNWALAGQWSSGAVPGAGDDVTISAAGAYTVLITGSQAAHSVTLRSSSAKLTDSGTLTLGTTLALDAGTFAMSSGGVMQGGTIVAAGGTFVPGGGTLAGVTYQGTLDMSSKTGAALTVMNGMSFAGAGGNGAGLVLLTGNGSTLTVDGNTNFANATIDIGNSLAYDTLSANDTGTGAVLTLGKDTSLVQTGYYTAVQDSGGSGDGIVNQGTIDVGVSGVGGFFSVAGNSFANQGAVAVSNGGWLDVNSAAFSNSGWVKIDSASLLWVHGSFNNTGAVTIAAGSTLEVDGSFNNTGTVNVAGMLAAEGTFGSKALNGVTAAGGTVEVTALMNNAGSTLNVGTGAALGTIALSGTISGGTVHDAGSGIDFVGGTLAGVTYQGTLDLSSQGADPTIVNGITVTGMGGGGTGVIQLTGQGSKLNLVGATTLSNVNINIGNNYGYDDLNVIDPGTGAVLTLAGSTNLVQTGWLASVADGGQAGDGIVNLGTIGAGIRNAGGNFYVIGNSFINQGSIAVANGGFMAIESARFSNMGTVTVAAGSTLEIDGSLANTGVITVAGTLELNGTLSTAALKAATLTAGTVELDALLNNAGNTLTIGTGAPLGTIMMQGGTISGGIVHDMGGGLNLWSAVLDGVTYQGTLDLSAPGAYMCVTDGIALTDKSGTGAGTILLTGANSDLSIAGNTTLSGVTIDIGAASYTYLNTSDLGGGTMLTFAGDARLVQTGYYVSLASSGASGDGFVNQGTIGAGVARLGGVFSISGNSFANQGSIALANGGGMTVYSSSFLNTGVVTVAAGSVLAIDGNLAGAGTINVAGLLSLGGTLTTPTLNTVALNGGSIAIDGLLDNTGCMFGVGAGTAFGTVALGGTISNGVVWDGSSGFVFGVATLDSVEYRGTLDLSGNAASVTVTNGITLTGTTGSGAGTVLLTGISSELDVAGTAALSGVTIDIGNNSYYSTLSSEDLGAGAMLTLGSNTELVQTGYFVNLTGGGNAGDSIVNRGSISAGLSSGGGIFTIGGNNFANQGSLSIANGGAMTISGGFSNTGSLSVSGGGTLTIGGTLQQLAGGTLAAGSYEVDAGSTLLLPEDTAITADNAAIILSGAGSVIESFSSTTYQFVTLDATLDSIGSGATLELLAGRGFTAVANGGSFTDNGQLQLGDAVFTGATLTIGGAGSLTGNGSVQAAIVSSGAITATDGTLTLAQSTSLTGTIGAKAAADLELTAGGSLNATISGAGTLELSGATTYAVGSGVSDTIAAILVDAGTTLNDVGVLGSTIINDGSVSTNGSLTVGAVSGSGLFWTAANALLDFTGGGTWSGAVTGAGTLQLDGSAPLTLANANLSGASLVVDAGAMLAGNGTVLSAIANAGTIESSGGTLALNGALSGSGALVASAGAVLNLTAGGALATSISGAGTLRLDRTTPFAITAADSVTVGTVAVDAGAKLSGTGTVSSLMIDAGTIAASGGTLTLSGAVSGGGTLTAVSGAVLNLAGGGDFAGTFNGLGTLDLGNGFVFDPGARLAVTDVVQTGTATVGNGSGNAEIITVTANATYDLAATKGAATLAGGTNASFSNVGLFQTTGGAAATVSMAFFNRGTLQSGSGTLSFLGGLTNTGTITDNGNVLFASQVSGAGTVDLASHATATFSAGTASGSTMAFLAGAGVLDLGSPAQFASTIAGFSGSDAIDLLATKETSTSYAGNVLTVKNGSTTVASLALAGNYTQANFILASDGNNGTVITFKG